MAAQEINGAQVWAGGLAVDADGCSYAYAPAGSGLVGLDYLANAGKPGDYFGLVKTAGGEPIIQKKGPHAGFYLSPSALSDHTKGVDDPARYVDAATIPYISIPHEMLATFGGPLHLGDVAMVWRAGITCAAIVADVGPRKKYGEGSIALARALGVPASPKNGGCSSGVVYIAWPGSARTPAWPRTPEDVTGQVSSLFAAWGGSSYVPNLIHVLTKT